MTLPTSRNTTYAVGVEIESADLNDLQDMIIGGKHGSVVRQIAGHVIAASGSFVATAGGYSVGDVIGMIDLPTQTGEIITAVTVYLKDSGTVYTYQLKELVMTTEAVTAMSDIMTSSGGSANQSLAATTVVATATAAGTRYFLEVDTGSATARTYGVEYTVEHAP